MGDIPENYRDVLFFHFQMMIMKYFYLKNAYHRKIRDFSLSDWVRDSIAICSICMNYENVWNI